jgi:hypothetical protein
VNTEERSATAVRSLVIESLPVPDRRLNPNKKAIRVVAARLKRQLRRDAGLAAYAAIGPDAPRPVFPAGVRVQVDALVHYPGNVFPDDDNFIASCKALIDGVTDGGAMANDKQARWRTIVFEEATTRTGATMTLTLTAESKE